MKKLTVGLLVLALVITLFPASVLAADAAWIGTTGYATLEDAVNAAKSGDTITLSVGNYTLYKKGAVTKGKDLTFVGQGAGKTVWGSAQRFRILPISVRNITATTALTAPEPLRSRT